MKKYLLSTKSLKINFREIIKILSISKINVILIRFCYILSSLQTRFEFFIFGGKIPRSKFYLGQISRGKILEYKLLESNVLKGLFKIKIELEN